MKRLMLFLRLRINKTKRMGIKTMGLLVLNMGLGLSSCSSTVKATTNVASYFQNGIKASDKYEIKEYKLSDISGIEINGVYEVVYKVADKPRVVIKAPENFLPLIRVEENDHVLRVYNRQSLNVKSAEDGIRIVVYAPSVHSFSLSGMCELGFAQDLEDKEVAFSLSGMSDVYVRHINCNSLQLDLSGMCELKSDKVEATNFSAEVSGKSTLKASHIQSSSVEMDVSGMSDVSLDGTTVGVSYDVSGMSEVNAPRLVAEKGSADVSGMSHLKCNVRKFIFDNSGRSSVENKATN